MIGIFSKIERLSTLEKGNTDDISTLLSEWTDAIRYFSKIDTEEFTLLFSTREVYNLYLHALQDTLLEFGLEAPMCDADLKEFYDKCAITVCSQQNVALHTNETFSAINEDVVKVVGVYKTEHNNDVNIFLNSTIKRIPEWILYYIREKYKPEDDGKVNVFYTRLSADAPYLESYDLALVRKSGQTIELTAIKDVPIIKPYKTYWNDIKYSEIPYENYVLQPKFNGMKIVITANGVYSDDKNKLKLTAEQILDEPIPDNIVLIGEIWSEDIPRQTVIGNTKKGEIVDGMKFTAYDCINLNDLTEPYIKRYNDIKTYTKAYVKNIDKADVMKIIKQPCYDGIVIKDENAASTDTKQMIKIKKAVDIDVRIKHITVTKSKTYVYEVTLDMGDGSVDLGKTMSSAIKFEINDVIEVMPMEITHYTEEDKIKLYGARVKGKSSKSKTDSVGEVKRIAEENGILNII